MAEKIKIRPLQDRIIVKRVDDEENTTAAGLVIPDSAKEKPQRGEVMAVGQGKRTEDGKKTPVDVKPGDKVLFSKYAGSEIKVDGHEYLIMREDDVLGVVEK